ncbi:MAG: hypothetical protein OHK0035_35880 [Cyanobacteria bacterium J069]
MSQDAAQAQAAQDQIEQAIKKQFKAAIARSVKMESERPTDSSPPGS